MPALPARAAENPVAPLAFADFYKRPIGPRGLEPTAKLIALTGATVHLRGFVVHGSDVADDAVIVAPVPVTLSDEDEALADDLPAAVAYLHASPGVVTALRRCPGPVEAIGVLETGPLREADERYSVVRLAVQAARCTA